MDKIVLTAFIAEALWETVKTVKQGKKISIDRIGAIAMGILIAAASGVDLFAVTGIPLKIPYLGVILTGLLISRGSNFVHDILGSMGQVYQKNKSSST